MGKNVAREVKVKSDRWIEEGRIMDDDGRR
jgi:hypothetical protein